MQWNMPDEQFCDLLDWRDPLLAGIDQALPAGDKALAAARAIRTVIPRTLTVPQRTPALLSIWQTDYADDVAFTRDLLERTVFDAADRRHADPGNYSDINERNLRHNQTHRHQAMPLAARLFALTGQVRYIGLCAGLIQAFVQQAPCCPDGDEPAWASWMAGYTGMEVIRASHMMENWLLALPILRPHVADEDYLVFLKALACGADYHWNCWRHNFYHNYTRHGVRAAAGVGLAFPMFRDSRKWLQLGIDRFFGDMTAPPVCLDDGYTRESIGYQNVNAYVTAKWYLLCKAHGIPVPASYESQLKAMSDFAARTVKPDGSHPNQGETSPDSSHEHYTLTHELLQLGAAMFGRPDWRAAAGSLNDDRLAPQWLWILDPEVYDRWKAMPKASFGTRAMPSGHGPSNLCTLRAGRGLDALCVQTWALRPRNHGHYDALHLDVYGGGRTLISDAGFASYAGSCRQRDWQPQRHSSIHLVGLSQAAKEFYNDSYTSEVLWHEDGALAACGIQSTLYLDYVIRRFVLLIKPENAIAVIDTVQQAAGGPVPIAPLAGIETRFAFHTPVMQVGRDGLAVWSQHVPSAQAMLHRAADTELTGKGARPFNWSEICRVLSWGDSDANVFVRPLLGTGTLRLEVQRDWVCLPGGIVPRPVARYATDIEPMNAGEGNDKNRADDRDPGQFGVVQAWEVQPFRGLQPPAGALEAESAAGHDVLLRSSRLAVVLRGAGVERPHLEVERQGTVGLSCSAS